MKTTIINWFYSKDSNEHSIKDCALLLAGAVIAVAGLFAFGVLVGICA